MNKRGQFFLVAAIVVIGIIMGFTTTVNSAGQGPDNSPFYDLSNEIGYETKQAIDYSVINDLDTEFLTKDFLSNYSGYIAQEEALFIFGNESNLSALHFISSQSVGSVALNLGESIIIDITSSGVQEANVTFLNSEEIVAEIERIDYNFNLKKGKNFYFVLIKTQDGERIVAKK